MKLKTLYSLIFISSLLLTTVAKAADTFQIDSSQSTVQFTAHPPFKIVGKTSEIKGWGQGSLDNLINFKAEVEVPLDSLETGNKQRDKTMREKCLETKIYPTVKFTLKQVLSPARLIPSQEQALQVEGEFDLHGVKRTQTIPVTTLYDPARQTFQIHVLFPLKLSDYNIHRPTLMFFKFSDDLDMDLKIVWQAK